MYYKPGVSVSKDMRTAGQVKEINRIIALSDPHKGLTMQQTEHRIYIRCRKHKKCALFSLLTCSYNTLSY